MKTCIDLIEFEEFLESLNAGNKKLPKYKKHLNELSDEELVKEFRINRELADYIKYHYDFVRAQLITEVINPCRLVSYEYPVPFKNPDWAAYEPRYQVEAVLDTLTSIRMIADRSLDCFKVSPPLMHDLHELMSREELVELCVDLAFESLTYYYRLIGLSNRVTFEICACVYVLGYDAPEDFRKRIGEIPEILLKEGLGIVETADGFDYSKRIKGIGNLYDAIGVIDDDVY